MKYAFSTACVFSSLLISTTFFSCIKSDDDAKPVLPLEAKTVTDLPANPTQQLDGSPVAPTNRFTLYSFKENAIVANADSASTKWDIGFRGTTIIFNGGTSGPGQGAVQLVTGIFEEVNAAPAEGYLSDSAEGFALRSSDWSTYTGEAPAGPKHAVIPIPGKVFVIKTAEGHFAKMEILSYYAGNPDTSAPSFADTATRPPSRYYTFRYLYQSNGSNALN
jgi:hypothetical protein